MNDPGRRRVLEIPVPVPAGSPEGFRSTTCLLDGDLLLTSWVEGRAAARVGVLDLTTGHWRVLKGVRGMLRGALLLAGERALLLSEHGLFDVDLAALSVTRKLTTGIGRHNDALRLEPDGLIAVGHRERATETLVSPETFAVVRRRRRGPLGSPTLTPALAKAGFVRLLGTDDQFVVGATSAYPIEAQEVVVLAAADSSLRARVPAQWGVDSVLTWGDGLIVAPPDLARSRCLLAVPGLRDATGDGFSAWPELRDAALDDAVH